MRAHPSSGLLASLSLSLSLSHLPRPSDRKRGPSGWGFPGYPFHVPPLPILLAGEKVCSTTRSFSLHRLRGRRKYPSESFHVQKEGERGEGRSVVSLQNGSQGFGQGACRYLEGPPCGLISKTK
ncbi:hypothetical protein IE53DRAFT_390680 [Violaceomyces palustris]|uniref:Uncharacterized protein n=1 Tax=Violaceomyces palustris TaxID=1673888 RepID=A0ACD0NMX0_9BASI|nr:hypothetical protein IE53DRAFT_390680 [Violaceomyces palustris]